MASPLRAGEASGNRCPEGGAVLVLQVLIPAWPGPGDGSQGKITSRISRALAAAAPKLSGTYVHGASGQQRPG